MNYKVPFKSIKELFVILLISQALIFTARGQTGINDSINIETDTDLIKPNVLSTHPFGIFISRINHNFKVRSPEKYSFGFEISSGNVMLPYVKSYELTNPADQKAAASAPWYDREFMFDPNTVPAKTKEFIADAIVRSYRFDFSLPFSPNNEINFSLRANSIDGGKFPYSAATSDSFIEWFHSNFTSEADPLSRRYYGYNKAVINYKDENGRIISMKGGDFALTGLETNYFYYPKLKINKDRRIYLNFGSHLGINFSKYNPSTDLGISASAIKKVVFKNHNKIFTYGFSAGLLRQGIIRFGDHVDISNNNYFYSFEGLLNYKKRLRSGNSISYGINFNSQSSYFKNADLDHIVLTGKRLKTHWEQTIYHLYQNLRGWSFILTYSVKKMSYFVYLREDLKLDDAPDLQTGIGVKLSILN